ncbi:MAG: hypothetical protein RL380_365 [Verrucomicrobiota bacterium]
MKNLLLVLVGALVGAGIAFPLVSQQSNARLKTLQAEVDSLKAAAAGNVNTGPTSIGESPVQILARLNTLDPVPRATRAKVVRQIVHDLQALVNCGQPALLEIRRFFSSGRDIEYVFPDERPQPENFWAWHPGQPLKVAEFILPPSLRLGLIDACRYIGGEDAEVSLAFVLNSSKRGFEIAGASQILESMNKGSYTKLADDVAKKLLASPAQSRSPLDAISANILLAMLAAHGDTSLVPSAKEGLITTNGTIDVTAAQYLTGVKKEKAVTDLYEAYQRPGTTADTRAKLASLSLNYVGISAQADQMVGDLLKNEAIDSNTRSVNILLLGDAVPGMHSTTPVSHEVAAKRINFLQDLATVTKNEQLKKAIVQAVTALQAIK